MSEGPIEPDERQLGELAAVAGSPSDGPIVMLNLNRYRAEAAYEEAPPGGLPAQVSGREAYGRYALVAMGVLERVGGRILWHAEGQGVVIGTDDDSYDDVIAVWYPSVAAFVALATGSDTLEALPHRRAGLERATIIRCAAGPEPALTAG